MKFKKILFQLLICIFIGVGLISCGYSESSDEKNKISIDSFTYEITKNSEDAPSNLSYNLSFNIGFSMLDQSASTGFSFIIERRGELNMTIDYCNTEDVEIPDTGHIFLRYKASGDAASMNALVNLKINTIELIDDINRFLVIKISENNLDEIEDYNHLMDQGIFKMNYSDGSSTSSDVIHYKFDEFSESYEVVSVIVRTNSLQIPETYQDYPVEKIAEGAFKIESELEELVLPSTLTSLSEGLLKEMKSLKSLTIPFIGASVNDTENGYLGYLFGANTYELNLSYVPSTLKEIHLTATTSIGDYAFYKCSNITNITIPNSIKSIGYKAFFECSQLKYEEYSNGYYLGNEENPYLAFVKVKSTGNYDFNLHMNTKVIAASAFYYYAGLKSIDLPNGLITIGKEAFFECYKLKNIKIPDSVIEIHNGAFRGCSELTSVVIPSKIKEIENSVFLNCTNLTSVTIPEGVTSIGMFSFGGCHNLADIVLPQTLIYIEDNAFENCSSFKNVIIPKNVVYIEEEAFKGCNSLLNISIPNDIAYISSNAFMDCLNLTYNEYDNGYYLGNEENPYLLLKKTRSSDITRCNIHSDTKIIGQNAFYGDSKIQTLTIPSGVRIIGRSAFNGCKNLANITIPNSVTTVDNYAFHECSSLVYNEYENGYYLGNEENPYYIFVKAKSADIKSCTVHENTGIIYFNAFKDCNKLTSITLGSHITTIGQGAFENSSVAQLYFDGSIEEWCKIELQSVIFSGSSSNHFYLKSNDNNWEEITNLEIPEGITDVGQYQFANFNNITFVTIGEGTELIHQKAFYGCSNLVGILMPNTIKTIGAWSFSSCDNLKELYYMGTLQAWNKIGKHISNLNSSIYIYSMTKPNTHGYYWHYVDGIVTKW